jgi:hypothetical protein
MIDEGVTVAIKNLISVDPDFHLFSLLSAHFSYLHPVRSTLIKYIVIDLCIM